MLDKEKDLSRLRAVCQIPWQNNFERVVFCHCEELATKQSRMKLKITSPALRDRNDIIKSKKEIYYERSSSYWNWNDTVW